VKLQTKSSSNAYYFRKPEGCDAYYFRKPEGCAGRAVTTLIEPRELREA
jgi:hypothetical protein